MSLITGAIEHVKFRPDLVAAFDFSQLDGSLTATSLYGSGGQTITFSGVQQASSDGVLLDGTQTATLNEEVPRTTMHFLYFLKPTVPHFELIDKTVGWDFKLYVADGIPAMYYKSSYDGKSYTVAHPNALQLNKLTLLSFMNAHPGYKQIIGIGDFGGPTISNETQTNAYNGSPIEAGTPLFGNFAGSCAGLLIFNDEVSDADIIEIMAEVGIYGYISLPTNLNKARRLSGTTLTAARAVDGNFTIAADSQTLEGYSESKIGELLEFVAFDTDEAGSIYKTVPVDPSLTTELDFQAIVGGTSGGDSGQSSKVSGIVQIDGTPAQRTVRAFGYNPTVQELDGATVNLSKSLGHATSDPQTGEYTIDLLAGYARQVFVVAFDDYGADFQPDMALAVGDRVHPSTPNGYVWECAGAGTLPSEEPAWIIDTETAQLYGTASMIAKPFYRPMVHGPVAPEVTFTVAGDPHWDKVVSLLHFDGDFADERGSIWIAHGGANTQTTYTKFGTGSGTFPYGTLAPISTPDSEDLRMGTSDFTIEGWFLPYASPQNFGTVYVKGANTQDGFLFEVSPTTVSFRCNGQTTFPASIPAITEFTHIAVVRASDVVSIFVSGQRVLQQAVVFDNSSTSPLYVGSNYHPNGNPAYSYCGLVDEFRITKGVARYTENFTPPTAPFPNHGVDNGEPEPPALPTVIGEAFGGGFYAGDIEDGGQWYKLIVSDTEADVNNLKWMDPRGDWPQAASNTDGPSNTLSMAGVARFGAGNHCLDYRGGGFDDWYMPARSELQVIYNNLGHNKNPPAGFESGGAQAFQASYYWCSTQHSANSAWFRRFSDGYESYDYKSSTYVRLRPVRRIPFTPEAG